MALRKSFTVKVAVIGGSILTGLNLASDQIVEVVTALGDIDQIKAAAYVQIANIVSIVGTSVGVIKGRADAEKKPPLDKR